jgi:Scavenger mRNA decapping enzyme C-term binding
MDPNCLFCKIGAKQTPAKLVYEDEDVFAFEDINPQAPTHILICPKKHFAALHDAEPGDQTLLGRQASQGVSSASRLSHRVQQRQRRRPVRFPFAPAPPRRPQFPLAPRLTRNGRLLLPRRRREAGAFGDSCLRAAQ